MGTGIQRPGSGLRPFQPLFDIAQNMIGNSTTIAGSGSLTPAYDVVIRNGLFFDGSGSKPTQADVAIDGGKVRASASRLPATGRREIDAKGCWVMPGMLDIHTHYDAEIEAMPGLDESVRHGVTTVVMGNCSLSTAVGKKKDILDLFCRVESLPRDVLSRWLGDELSWHSVAGYYEHLDKLPIGPNVSSFVGHSSIRAHVMGMERSLKVSRPNRTKSPRCSNIVDEAMDAGYLGLSIDMLPWHRMDGEPFCGFSVPSQHATPHEYRQLGRSGAAARPRVAGHAQRANQEHGGPAGHAEHGRVSQAAADDDRGGHGHQNQPPDLSHRHEGRPRCSTGCFARISAGRRWPSRF